MIITLLLIKPIYILKIYMKQNIDILLTNVKALVSKNRTIQRLLLNIQIICWMSIKILENTTQEENVMINSLRSYNS